jgi:hypothetical protein
MPQRKELTTERLVTVGELAIYLNCTEKSLYELIRKHKWGPHQGVFRLFGHSKRGIRIDEAQFLYWRELPNQMLGDSHIQQISMRMLSVLRPLLTQLSFCVAGFEDIYESATKRIERQQCEKNGMKPCSISRNQDQ